MDDSQSRSWRRSRHLSSTRSNAQDSSDFTLSLLMRRLEQSHVPGPWSFNDCHRGAKFLGRGNQFEVFGLRVEVNSAFPRFDGPFLSSDPHIESREYESQSGRKMVEYKQKYVAVKRAKFLTKTLTGTSRLDSAGIESVGQNQLRDTLLEVVILTYEPIRQHPNVVKLLAWGHDRRGTQNLFFSPIFFTEMALTSLRQMCSTDILTWSLKGYLCRGMVSGIRALHEYGIVHGDIKTDNVLIFASQSSPFCCVAKIADFGLSVQDLDDGVVKAQDLPRGTEGWAAPEQSDPERLAKAGKIHRCDIWSSALTIWSCMVHKGEVPDLLPDIHAQLAQEFEQENFPFKNRQKIISTLCAMLQTDPGNRADDFGLILDALAGRKTWDDSAESKQKFLALFEDHNDWAVIEKDSLRMGHLRWNGTLDTLAGQHDLVRSDQYSWAHSMQKSMELASRDILLLHQLSSESSTTVDELFDMSLAYALEGRHERELEGLEKCSLQGYVAAQAIFAPIHAARAPMTRSHKPPTHLPIEQWSDSAVSSGYLFSEWTAATELKSRLPAAQEAFREQGGYNSHYCSRHHLPPGSEHFGPNKALLGSIADSLAMYPVHVAAAYNELATSSGPSCLIDNIEDINRKDPWGYTALIRACMSGSLESLRVLVAAGANGEVANQASGLVALHWLFVFPEHEIDDAAILLLKAGAIFSEPHQAIAMKALHFPFAWPSGDPLHWAVFANNTVAVDTLIRHGARIDEKDVAGQTPLHTALKMLNIDMVKSLLDRGALLKTYPEPYDEMWNDGGPDLLRTPVHDFLWSQLELGGDPDLDGFDDLSLVFPDWYDHFIFANNDKPRKSAAMIDIILDREPDCLYWRDSKNRTAIDYQMSFGRTDSSVFQKLIDHGPPVDAVRDGDFSVLFWLFDRGKYTVRWDPGKDDWEPSTDDRLINERLCQILKTLPYYRRALFVNRKEPDYSDEMSNPFSSKHIEIQEQRIGRNHTALHAASVLGLPTCVKTLLKSGAEPKVKSNIGDTPLDLLEKVLAEPLASHWNPDLNMEHPGLKRERDLREDEQIKARNDRIPGRMAVAEILRNADQFYRACD